MQKDVISQLFRSRVSQAMIFDSLHLSFKVNTKRAVCLHTSAGDWDVLKENWGFKGSRDIRPGSSSASLWRPSASGSEPQFSPTPFFFPNHPSLACCSCTRLSWDEISDRAPWRLQWGKDFLRRDLNFFQRYSFGRTFILHLGGLVAAFIFKSLHFCFAALSHMINIRENALLL